VPFVSYVLIAANSFLKVGRPATLIQTIKCSIINVSKRCILTIFNVRPLGRLPSTSLVLKLPSVAGPRDVRLIEDHVVSFRIIENVVKGDR